MYVLNHDFSGHHSVFEVMNAQKNKHKWNYNFEMYDKINVKGWRLTEGAYSLTCQPNHFVTLNRDFATDKRRQKVNLQMDLSKPRTSAPLHGK